MPGAEIPVWVGGLQKWVTGLTKKTTCEDVVRVLLRSEGRPQVELDTECAHHVLVERWRKVERPLDSKTRVLKVWKAWAEEQPNVRITLRRSPHPPTPSALTPREVKALRNGSRSSNHQVHGPRSRHSHGSTASKMAHVHTIHPKKLMQHAHYKQCSDMDGRITGTMERLMKVIIAQGQTIQAQLQRLQDKDHQIDFFEQQMHVMRVEEMGANYLLDSYLGGHKTGIVASSTKDEDDEDVVVVDADQQTTNSAAAAEPNIIIIDGATPSSEAEDEETEDKVLDLRRCARHYERLLLLSDRLEREENMVSWLTSQIEHFRRRKPLDEEEAEAEVEEEVEVKDDEELELLRERVGCLAAQNVSNDAELDENESIVVELCRSIADKQCYVAHLERDLGVVEVDSCRLKRSERDMDMSSASVVLDACTAGGVSSSSAKDKDRHNDTDSNSDTGLSSLHSSCDEGGPGAYVLDTLV